MEIKAREPSATYINSLSGFKVICVILVFSWHAFIPRGGIDWGARACQFLFLASGFLVGYNYYGKDVPCTWEESFRYVGKKLSRFWPLHAISLFVLLLLFYGIKPPLIMCIHALINLLLLQAWSSKTLFSFNGATWFLSALIFCYFLTPFLLKLAKKVRTSCVFFILAFLIRFGLEEVKILYPDGFWFFSLHSFPIVRALEFTMGMMMIPLFMKGKAALHGKNTFWFMTLLECASLAAMIWMIIRFAKAWYGFSYLIPSSVMMFIFAYDGGGVSRLLACKPIRWFSGIQLEFFILHQVVLMTLSDLYQDLLPGEPLLVLALFFTTVVLAVGYKLLLEDKFARFFTNAVNRAMVFLQLDFRL